MDLLMLCLCLLSVTLIRSTSVNINEVNDNTGLYYDPVYSIKFIEFDWDLITNLDYSFLDTKAEEIIKTPAISKAHKYCRYFADYNSCEQAVYQSLNEKINLINSYASKLNNALTDINIASLQSAEPANRQRYHTASQILLKDENTTTRVVANRTQIIRSSFNLQLQQDLETLFTKLHNETTSRLNALDQIFQNKNQTLKSKRAYYAEEIQRLITIYESAADDYIKHLHQITEVTMLAVQGQLDHELLSLTNLEAAINTLINSNLQYTSPISRRNIIPEEVYKLAKINFEYYNRHLIVILQLPLLSKKTLQLYKIHTYPTIMGIENQLNSATIKIHYQYLAVSSDMKDQVLMHESEIYFCITLEKYHICQLNNLTRSTMTPTTCEISAFNHKKDVNCHYQLNKTFTPYWQGLNKGNKWLYSLPRPENVLFTCEHQPETTIQLIGAGVLSLLPGCLLQTSTTLLLSHPISRHITTWKNRQFTHEEINIIELHPLKDNYQLSGGLQNPGLYQPGFLILEAVIICLVLITLLPVAIMCYNRHGKINSKSKSLDNTKDKLIVKDSDKPDLNDYDRPRPGTHAVYFQFDADLREDTTFATFGKAESEEQQTTEAVIEPEPIEIK